MAALTRDEILAYALALLYAEVEIENDHDVYELLLEQGHKVGVDIPAGDEYQRAVLHRFDPERVPDFPLPDASEPGAPGNDDDRHDVSDDGLVDVHFRWSRNHGDCYECGLPAAYSIDQGAGSDDRPESRRCCVCAALAASDGETIHYLNRKA